MDVLKNEMQKIKLAIGLFVYLVIGVLIARPAYATVVPIVQIQSLPGYINYTDFKLSCTSNGNTAQFYSKKDGGSYTAFGPSIDLTITPCLVQVNGSQFGSEGKFWFEVIVDGVPSETSTTLDTTAPGNVSNFGKDRIGGGTVYHIYWKNPLDSDYQRVFIYRGTEAGFEADSNHKIAEAGGSPGDTLTWDDGVDPTKEYYYYVRALDKAGNSSGLVGDTSTTTVVSTPKPGISGTGGTGKVTQLPKEGGTGTILGIEASPSISPEAITGSVSTNPGLLKWILTHKKISLGVVIVLGLLGYAFYRRSKKSR